MKQIKTTYLLIAILLGGLAACSKMDDTDVTLYDDAAITSFTLGTVNRYVNGVKSTFNGSDYLFHIDQVNRTIYNTDSLPIGTDAAHIVCGLTTYNNSQPYIISTDGSYMTYHSTSDSIDFTTPRTFRAIASSGAGYTDYTVKVNVHKENPDAFVWKKMTDIPVMNDLRTIMFNDQLYVFGNEGGTTTAYTTEDGSAWTPITLPTTADANTWQNAVATIDSLYIMCGTKVYRTQDLTTWDEDNSDVLFETSIKQLIGASSQEVYALSTSGMLMSKYSGNLNLGMWIPADFFSDINVEDLPTDDYAFTCYPMAYADSTDYVVMGGTKKIGDEWQGRVWRRIVDYSGVWNVRELEKWRELIELIDEQIELGKSIEEIESVIETVNPTWIRQWTYMERTGNKLYELPALKNLQLVYYGEELLAFGGQSYDDSTAPLIGFWRSRDNGITWKQDVNYTMPPMDGTTQFDDTATSFSAAADNEGNIWIVSAGTGEVWRGRLNRVAWEE